jgi:transposase
MAKWERAPRGAWDIIDSVRNLVKTTSVDEAAARLEVSTSTVYKFLKVARENIPARTLMKQRKTLDRWEDRLNRAKIDILESQVTQEPPPMGDKEAAQRLQAISPEERWNYQKITAMRTRHAEPAPPMRGPDQPAPAAPTGDMPTRSDYEADPNLHYFVEDGVRFVDAGYTFAEGDFLESRDLPSGVPAWDLDGLKEYIKQSKGGFSDYVVVQIEYDEYGQERYSLYFYYEE